MQPSAAPQRVLVTAAASGIGLAIAKAFVATGAKVHIADIDADAVRAAIGAVPALSATVADVSDPAAVERMFVDAEAALGGLDVLINNAGIAGPTAAVTDTSTDDWNAVVAVNLNGTFFVTRRAIPLLMRSRQASIVVMSSVAGRFGYPNRIAYATTKWGLVGFAKTLAMELGPHGITCNTIHPGVVEGERMRRVLKQRAEASGRSVDDEIAIAQRNQSLARFVDPADIGALAVFLAGPHARSISGQAFPIDGDSKSTQ